MRINYCVKGAGVIRSEVLESIAPVVSVEQKSDMQAALSRIGITAAATSSVLSGFFLIPESVFAVPDAVFASAGTGAFENMHRAIMTGFDSGVVLVIIFAGACWGLGHRGRALEILIGCCCGYLLARHAVDIRDFLKGI